MDLERIYNEYFASVYRFVLSMTGNPDTAEEITQETFFRALKKIDTFRGESNIRVWLCQIAKNLYIDETRKKAKNKLVSVSEIDPQTVIDSEAATGRGPATSLVHKETAMDIYRIVHDLAEPYKEVFQLKAYCDVSYADIGKLFGKSESWARVTYYRARMKIKEELDEYSL